VMIEALACGTPVVAAAMGSAPEIVRDGEVGILAGAYQWDEMVAAIKDGRLDDVDPRRCRELVRERFSVEAMLDGYEAAFEKIVASGAGSRAQGDGLNRTELLQN
jgi:glycosyltransferase involved in cell wall biosynthesis